jgi:Glycosyl transferase family 2
MNAAPTISVLMTSYNRESYIAASIDSVLAQTCDDFELLITDNQSTDRSVEIAQEYAQRDARIRVVVNESNLGQFGNRNRAAQLARGRFLKYHDSDDIMYPHCLATMLALLEAEPHAGFALSNSIYWAGGPCPMLLTPRMCYQREFLGQGLFMCAPSSALFRADVFRELGGFPDMGVGSDHLFWLHACAQVNVLLVPADLFWYRVHAGQEFQSERAGSEYAIVPGACWQALKAATCPLTAEETEQAKRNLVYTFLKLTYRDVRRRRWTVAQRRVHHFALSTREWLRYLRIPKRDLLAGTPRDEQGDFLVPDRSTYRVPPSTRDERVA